MEDRNETHDPVRRFLLSYREAVYEHRRMDRKIEELETQCLKVTAKYGVIPGGGGGNGNTVWDALVMAKAKAAEKLAEMLKREAEVEQFIDSIPSSLHRGILRMRYLELQNWGPICVKLNYSERQMRRHYDDALQAARELWWAREREGGRTDE